jgi:hypothetical protein
MVKIIEKQEIDRADGMICFRVKFEYMGKIAVTSLWFSEEILKNDADIADAYIVDYCTNWAKSNFGV